MFASVLIAILAGIFIGIFTGLIPGIHVNLVATAMLSISPFLLLHIEPLPLGAFLMALSVTHSFLDTIPSIYLGAPENENALSVLPGQKMLLEGQGYQAVKITILGTYFGMVAAIIMVPLFMLTAKEVFSFLKPYLPFLLPAIVAYTVISDRNRLWAAAVMGLSGALGIAVFSLGTLNEPLFPLLSGLFGVSGILLSIGENSKIPPQTIDGRIGITMRDLARSVFGASIGVIFIQFFPGLGPAQGAAISSKLTKEIKDKMYLSLVGAMGTMSVIFSLVTFYTLGKAKDGSIVALSKMLEIDLAGFILLVAVMLLAGSISVLLVLFFARVFSRLMSRVDYNIIAYSIIGFIMVMSLALNGWLGLVVLAVATSVGLIAPLTGAARSHSMGCLIVPVMLYLLL